jgi:hypothetical protein
MASPAVDVTPTTTRWTLWPPSRKISRLRGDNRLLHACQKLLRLRQRQPQIGYVAGPVRPADLHYVYPSHSAGHARLDQSQYPTHRRPPGQHLLTGHIDARQIPPVAHPGFQGGEAALEAMTRGLGWNRNFAMVTALIGRFDTVSSPLIRCRCGRPGVDQPRLAHR